VRSFFAATVAPGTTAPVASVADARRIAGGEDVAIFQPEFSPDGRHLAYISNETGWENLYLYDLEADTYQALTEERADLGEPAWVQGMRTYGFSADGRALYYLRNDGGVHSLWEYDLRSGEARPGPEALRAYAWFEQPAIAPGTGTFAAIASGPAIPARVVTARPGDGWQTRVVARAAGETVPAEDLSTPRPVSWATAGGATAHGLYYAPSSSRYTGTGLPPAIVQVHGGPTGQSTAAYSPAIQFFTTRGYAVLAVNYRGSTGYGRDYMQALRGQWGVYDVEDAVSAARHLADAGLADGERVAIMGGSAGGYTIWQALVHHPGIFKAALCSFGVSNLFTLAADTHKFEERYLDSMIGPLPEARALYHERSPIFFAERITDPVAIFQGDVDPVVPRAQSDTIVEVLRRRGVPHEYHVYEGEGHGWRKSETVAAYYRAADAFLKQHLLFG
jgi:dipeptidyl aminopeptidase/acylaminoacyl peptidase